MKTVAAVLFIAAVLAGCGATNIPDPTWTCGESPANDPCVAEYCCLSELCLGTCGASDLGVTACRACMSEAKAGPCKPLLDECLSTWGVQP